VLGTRTKNLPSSSGAPVTKTLPDNRFPRFEDKSRCTPDHGYSACVLRIYAISQQLCSAAIPFHKRGNLPFPISPPQLLPFSMHCVPFACQRRGLFSQSRTQFGVSVVGWKSEGDINLSLTGISENASMPTKG
jgi:hypothetical protein